MYHLSQTSGMSDSTENLMLRSIRVHYNHYNQPSEQILDSMLSTTQDSLDFVEAQRSRWISLRRVSGTSIVFEEYLQSQNIPDNLLTPVFEGLGACQCCERHQIARPNHIMAREDLPITPVSMRRTSSIEKPPHGICCECPCRHYARFLCVALGK